MKGLSLECLKCPTAICEFRSHSNGHVLYSSIVEYWVGILVSRVYSYNYFLYSPSVLRMIKSWTFYEINRINI